MAQILDVNPEFVASPCQNDSSLGARDIEERTKCNIPGDKGGGCSTVTIMQRIDFPEGTQRSVRFRPRPARMWTNLLAT
ncbi:hypothetical protein BA78_8882 [Aspergillus fumigatus]|nr:hypothetical protein BA78_8882 [Aspergillus fumigatus]